MDRELYERKEGRIGIFLPRGDDWAMARGEIPSWHGTVTFGLGEFAEFLCRINPCPTNFGGSLEA